VISPQEGIDTKTNWLVETSGITFLCHGRMTEFAAPKGVRISEIKQCDDKWCAFLAFFILNDLTNFTT
jgi:hypothetical protein